ncbi:hypothetical protein SKAU_G00317190 [Synaphobranchus kaupii]|uniref:Uncharacterized protein n=1 Tax=Synaphobranchus kaupii TaxID=118154 RepID=A0A9Q1ESU7_SYNKA|nr:hypothetical protein SKAU_G00317190 [Synaphobranchus kaupii]
MPSGGVNVQPVWRRACEDGTDTAGEFVRTTDGNAGPVRLGSAWPHSARPIWEPDALWNVFSEEFWRGLILPCQVRRPKPHVKLKARSFLMPRLERPKPAPEPQAFQEAGSSSMQKERKSAF